MRQAWAPTANNRGRKKVIKSGSKHARLVKLLRYLHAHKAKVARPKYLKNICDSNGQGRYNQRFNDIWLRTVRRRKIKTKNRQSWEKKK
jgi:hypothetical protein